MNNFIYKTRNVNNFDHYFAEFNDYGLRSEITTLAPQKYRVDIYGYDCLLVKSFICNTYEECKREVFEETKWIKEYSGETAGNFQSGEYELHHSWAGADITCLEKLKADAESYSENEHKCELAVASEDVDALTEIIKQDKKDEMSEQIKQIAKAVAER
jgi:hypothetical protein